MGDYLPDIPFSDSSWVRNNNNKEKKKIYNAHIVMNHESEAWAVARWPDGVW